MPWKEYGVIEERMRFVEEFDSGDWNMAELCRFYGVSRATGYKWVDRHEVDGLEGLRGRSRAPVEHPDAIRSEMEDLVIAERSQHPHWGAPRIRAACCGITAPLPSRPKAPLARFCNAIAWR
jgi:putative transposase